MVKVVFSEGSRAWANNLNDLRERWHLRREEPVNFEVPVKLFKEDLENLIQKEELNRDDLLNMKSELIALLDRSKEMLHRHQRAKRFDGVWLDPEKYSDLISTIKAIGRHVQEVNHMLAKEKKHRHEQNNMEMNSLIIKVTRKKVSDELWNEILDEANKRFSDFPADH